MGVLDPHVLRKLYPAHPAAVVLLQRSRGWLNLQAPQVPPLNFPLQRAGTFLLDIFGKGSGALGKTRPLPVGRPDGTKSDSEVPGDIFIIFWMTFRGQNPLRRLFRPRSFGGRWSVSGAW